MGKNLYCASCRRTEAPDTDACTYCGGPLRHAEAEDFVFLVTTDADDFKKLAETLDQEAIPYETKDGPLPPDGSIYSGRGLLPPKDVFVRYADYEQADRLLSGLFEKAEPDPEELPVKKRVLVQIVSVLLFILVICGVVYAADWIAAFVKSLF